MTPDERIEKLLNQAHNTISDLPTTYPIRAQEDAIETACHWSPLESDQNPLGAYICHLTDIIDRLEWALHNALIRGNLDGTEE